MTMEFLKLPAYLLMNQNYKFYFSTMIKCSCIFC